MDKKMKDSRYHACATCRHFSAERMDGKMLYHCKRLGFETKPEYQFNCWNPKDHIRKLMKKEDDRDNGEH
ncbi:hypothetical protein [Bacillus salacetis]|nr:hypothetical protein [Bacillus salacetis]